MAPPRLLIPALSASNFVVGMGAFVVIGLIEPAAVDFDVTPGTAGVLMTAYAIAYAILSPVLVSLTGRMGRRRVMSLGLGLFACAALLSAIAPTLTLLAAARVVAAAGAGMFTPIAAAVAAALYPPERRARVLAAVFFGLTLAQIMGVPAGAWVAYTFGWRWAFWLVVALALPALAVIWFYVPRGLSFQPVTLNDLGRTLRQGRMMLAVLFTASFLGSIYILYTYIAPLMSETMGYSRDGVAVVLAIFGIGAVIGNIAGGISADRIGWAKTLVTVCLLQILLLPVFSFLPLGDVTLLAVILIWSTAGWSFMAGQQMRLVGLAGAQAPVVLALNAAAIYVGAAGGSAAGAWIIDQFGVSALGIAASLGCVGALLHLIWSINRAPAVKHA
ncbi:MAG: MFS transporter [Pseudomonadota bacterium]